MYSKNCEKYEYAHMSGEDGEEEEKLYIQLQNSPKWFNFYLCYKMQNFYISQHLENFKSKGRNDLILLIHVCRA